MIESAIQLPDFPVGFRRRIIIHSVPGVVVAGLEDDVHRFILRLHHNQGVISGIQAQAERFPWTTCPDAGDYLANQMVGKNLAEIADQDPHQHCTHLYDLALLCCARADETQSIQYDLLVADRIEGRTTALLLEDRVQRLQWQLSGTVIEGPEGWAGRDLRQLSIWKTELSAADALRSVLLRRAVFVSGVRAYTEFAESTGVGGTAADRGPNRLGACYTYQLPQVASALQSRQPLTDFSQSSAEPLAGFNPESLLVKEIRTP